jgi:hypothetical protein
MKIFIKPHIQKGTMMKACAKFHEIQQGLLVDVVSQNEKCKRRFIEMLSDENFWEWY